MSVTLDNGKILVYGSMGLCPFCEHYNVCKGSTKGKAVSRQGCDGTDMYFPAFGYKEEDIPRLMAQGFFVKHPLGYDFTPNKQAYQSSKEAVRE